MLKLSDFDDIITPINLLYSRFADEVLIDIARRIWKMKFVPSAAWQVQRLIESGKLYDEILTRVHLLDGRTKETLDEIFKKFGIKSLEFDNRILQEAGVLPRPFNISKAMLNLLEASARRTAGLLKNLTLTTANAGQDAYLDALDLAYMHVSHGAMSYGQAVKEAIQKVADDGIQVIHFPSGRKDQIDVAVRRAVLTGVSAASGDVQIANLREQGVDLVAVSAHIGARDKGDLPENHEMWQGRIYTLGGNPQYPNFFEWTGYGTGPGLGGWNCRHSFYPFYSGISEVFYTEAMLQDYADRSVIYNGKKYSFYEATQIQRKIEREIRAKKREADALGAVGEDNWEQHSEIRRLQAVMRDFIKQTELQRQYVREGGATKQPKIGEPSKASISIFELPPEKVYAGSLEDLVSKGWVREEDPRRQTGAFHSERVRLLASNEYAMRKEDRPGNYASMASQYEAMAYKIDKYFGLNLVPETIFSEADKSSFQRYVTDATTVNRINKIGSLKHPGDVGILRFLDVLLANGDRHGGNWKIDNKTGHIIAIDNGYIFHKIEDFSDAYSLKNWIEDTIIYRGHVQLRELGMELRDKYYERAPNKFWGTHRGNYAVPIPIGFREKLENALKTGDFELWLEEEGKYLTEYQENDILNRARFMLKYWDEFFEEE